VAWQIHARIVGPATPNKAILRRFFTSAWRLHQTTLAMLDARPGSASMQGTRVWATRLSDVLICASLSEQSRKISTFAAVAGGDQCLACNADGQIFVCRSPEPSRDASLSARPAAKTPAAISHVVTELYYSLWQGVASGRRPQTEQKTIKNRTAARVLFVFSQAGCRDMKFNVSAICWSNFVAIGRNCHQPPLMAHLPWGT
jgi:hypothetical protein